MQSRYYERDVQTATITAIEDFGTIVAVRLRSETGWITPVFFDHRAFCWLLEGEGCSPEQLIGRAVSFDGERMTLLD